MKLNSYIALHCICSYQPPHVRRKNKISEMVKKFYMKRSEAEFFTSLLMNSSNCN